MESIKIYKLDSKGRGIGRYNNKPIFIFNALPNEEVLVKNINERSKYVTADSYDFIIRSDKRINPICPYFGVCGGCDLMHMSYDEQLKFKKDKVSFNIHSMVDSNIKVLDIKHSDNLHYRNKAEFKVSNNVGYYSKSTHEIVPVEKCFLVNDKINEILKFLRNKKLDGIFSILIRASLNDCMVVFNTDKKIEIYFLDELKSLVSTCILNVNGNEEVLFGKGYIIDSIKNFSYKISPKSFFQVNTDGAYLLYSTVLNYIKKGDRVLDLYCGTGSIGIFLSDVASSVLGVEINSDAVNDAFFNKNLNNLTNVDFKCLDTSLFSNDLSDIDTVVVDPPRSGMNLKTINYLLDQNVDKIVYVSCDLMTLCRDLNIMKDKYKILEVTPVDMFPNTYHVECVSVLRRKSLEK